MNATKNLMLPGNPRYQPQALKAIFGYDNLYRTVGEVEIAALRTLGEIGVIEQGLLDKLTTTLVATMLDEITTTEVDNWESKLKHDIRAWVRRASEFLSAHELEELSRWLHVPMTSYDALHTGRTLQYVRAWDQVLKPACKEVMQVWAERVDKFADTLQVGRTHGQHALPITVGFWLGTVLDRFCSNVLQIDAHRRSFRGKVSGAVGAYNAQVGLGFTERSRNLKPYTTFEERLLSKLDLKPAQSSTQILPPEPLAYFLHAACLTSASLGQLGRDCRHLMRSELNEVAEPFGTEDVGSSTMAHKRNPKTFENLEGMWLRTKSEYGKVFDALISEHQRDLVGSSLERDFPIILVNLAQQLDAVLRKDKETKQPFLKRLVVDVEACQRNFNLNAHLLLSEPLYIALIMGGYPHDAHELVNHTLTPRAKVSKKSLLAEWENLTGETEEEQAALAALQNLPEELRELLSQPEKYIGHAPAQAHHSARRALETAEKL